MPLSDYPLPEELLEMQKAYNSPKANRQQFADSIVPVRKAIYIKP